ncbi:MAG: acetyl-CoA carboxylase biotin carboxylase subunit [Coriobacteriales bacterium]|nr:acetyl-CoA carboxylase biotin carboxylase subunit [Coriobacteriales bacterium]
MFNKILIANRGEIALRIIRAAHELGIEAVAVYSEADAGAQFVGEADQAVCIGPAQSTKSYLQIPAIISAAKITGAQAIHPAYGFLAENADFARACENNDIKFIGPTGDCIEKMGHKSQAKQTMKDFGVPCVPGSDGSVATVEQAAKFADEVGYPVLIKASAGGGGKGMRVANDASELENMFNAAKAEAASAFGNDDVYLEKYILKPRHVEMQILADGQGNAIHLCERDCSVQRRHQKLIEEAPSPALSEETRQKMGDIAINAVKNIGYESAGTIEFLLDARGDFYFMEMNTRVQVEHTVSEQITNTDIIAEQIRIAAGESISCLNKAPFSPICHAIEFRINAEDPDNNFLPCPGKIQRFDLPGGPGVRVDTGFVAGDTISPYYDSMIAKLIVTGATRDQAIARGRRALDELNIEGIKTTTPFHRKVLDNAAFICGDFATDFIEVEGF